MKQSEFIQELKTAIDGLNNTEIKEIISDYSEYFREGKEQGRTESEIAAALGSPQSIANQILNKNSETQRLPGAYITRERSGVSWFKHAWHLFKKSPIMWIVLGTLISICTYLSGADVRLKKYELITYPVINLLSVFFITFIAFFLEETGKFSPVRAIDSMYLKSKKIFIYIVLNIFTGIAIQVISSLLFKHSFNFSMLEQKAESFELLFISMAMIISNTLLFFFAGIIAFSQAGVITSLKLSCKASIKYFPQLAMLFVTLLGWLLLVTFVAVMLPNIFPKEDFFKSYKFMYILLPPFCGVAMLCAYTSWAAVFRDGSMKQDLDPLMLDKPESELIHA